MTQQNSTNKKAINSEALSLSDLVKIALANWKWFVLSVIFCLGVAFYYVKKSPYIYSRSASVLIKDETKGTQLPNAAAAFSEQ